MTQTHVDDVGFVHFDLGGDDRHVGQGHERAAGRILDANHDRFAFPYRQVGDHAVVGRGISGFFQNIGGVGQVGAVKRDVAIGGIFLRLGLGDARLGLCQAGLRGLPRGFLAVVFRLRNQRIFEQTLGPGPIELGAFEVGLGAVQIGHGGIQRGRGGGGIGHGCLDGSLSGIHVGRGLYVFQLRQQLAFPDPVAFLDVKPGDFAEGIGPDVDVSLRPDLAGCAHNRCQILAYNFAGLHRDHTLAALVNGNSGNRQSCDGDADADKYFLSPAHCPLVTPSAGRHSRPLTRVF